MGRTVLKHKQFFKLLFQTIIAPLVNEGTRDLFASAVGPLEDKAMCLMWKQRSPGCTMPQAALSVLSAIFCTLNGELSVPYAEFSPVNCVVL